MIVHVIYDDLGAKAESKVIETLMTEDAMLAHGEAILRKERYDRNELSLACLVDDVFKSPTDTVVIFENQIGKVHRGLLPDFLFRLRLRPLI